MPPINGTVNVTGGSHTRQGGVATFQCDEGYSPSQVFTAVCNAAGLWTPPPDELNCTIIEGTVDHFPATMA